MKTDVITYYVASVEGVEGQRVLCTMDDEIYTDIRICKNYNSALVAVGIEREITEAEAKQIVRNMLEKDKASSNDGSNANTSHYDLPEGATELKHLIWYKDMNAQVGEIFRACYRLGTASHSSRTRDLRKIIAYAEQELERMERYE